MAEVIILSLVGWVSYKILSKVLRVVLLFFMIVAGIYFYHHGYYNMNFKTLSSDLDSLRVYVIKNIGELKTSSMINFLKKF